MSSSGISPSFLGLSRSSGQVTHVLLTRSRLCPGPKPGSSLHLHVLSTPPAFVLSQDQTLREELLGASPRAHTRHKELSPIRVRRRVHSGAAVDDGSISGPPSPATRSADRTWTHTGSGSDPGAHAVEFSKTARPIGKGTPSQEARPDATGDRRGPSSIARCTRALQAPRRAPLPTAAGL